MLEQFWLGHNVAFLEILGYQGSLLAIQSLRPSALCQHQEPRRPSV